MSYLMSNYAPLEVTFIKGEGCYLTDTKGDKYLDALSGVGVVGLGHCHPSITKAIQTQAAELLHTSNWYHIQHQEVLAEKLCNLSNMDNAFFANSGAEANEAAIKIARLHAHANHIDNPVILSAKQSFHGRTMATLSATGNEKVQVGFSPLVSEFIHIDFNDISAIKAHTSNKNIVAIMLEPIQGESGVIVPADDYLNQVQAICQANDWLLILDEVQTGIGRTGKLFAYQYNDITPDVLTLAKGLGNGVPIGACLAKGKAAALFTLGTHGSTFGGNPLACKTALSVLDTIEKDKILDNVVQMGEYLVANLQSKLTTNKVVEIRSKGLMIAIQLNQDCTELLNAALKKKLLINITGRSIRLLPPLIINQVEADNIINTLDELLSIL
ncbi:Acetylornithine aminotransferase [Bathymodiolus heckerae thiotrophic gill symbiont]|uniref:aspartate aminotransferase family protein n=1 Tax=Bathymodiolus heckerae thiotrophic gill symbiont TaxID=1052212 RepID=UPI0010B8227A|nr:aspartate aminotransferase family protein [Bathymodiolus heckerae thiotrophic gill symbiont]SMN13184.1 Acetylornithine aminotransferase [Bathymodiolus heckerae thiotrophic gill symbiont]SMN15162.1 Acetylornithine aminotransferase [uncultured Candidatus Thioglobus sp.]